MCSDKELHTDFDQNTADQGPATFSENCLTLNVVRPAGTSKNEKLPVGLFIHGGGWTMDFAANGAYNMTFMVEEATKAGKPFVAVSIACESISV